MPEVLITCEHAGHAVPARYRPLFRGSEKILASHRGWDPGALALARRISKNMRVPLVAGRYTRLLVDLNRSEGNPTLFSGVIAGFDEAEQERILRTCYRPYREKVAAWMEKSRVAGRSALHLSIHSFTPVLKGRRRDFEFGILYDPKRSVEKAFATRLRAVLQTALPDARVRMNQPYRGISDGLTSWLRRELPGSQYRGIELEVSQRLVSGPPARWTAYQDAVAEAVQKAI